MSKQITFVVTLPAKPAHSEAVGSDLMALLADTRAEPGAIEYNIHRSNDRSSTWMVYETWRSQADFDAHLQQPYTQAFLAQLPERLEGEIAIAPFTTVSPRA
ncbi:putative quinol monooxygenase [Variovorax sp. LjRoot290]|uniref:putative quinol monooxygenase n=1 Tax=Variovorax sp. LjRoot290 TaxID=3342316 RepID=UPI003ECF53E4